MPKKGMQHYFKYIFFAFFIFILVLAFMIIRPFLSSIIAGLFLAYLFFPVYKRVRTVITRPNLSAAFMTVCVSLIIIVPIAFIVQAIIVEVVSVYNQLNLQAIMVWFSDYFSLELQNVLLSLSKQALALIASLFSSFVLSLPQKVVNSLVILLTMFVAFRDGEKAVAKMTKVLPVKSSYKKEFIRRFTQTTDAIVYGIVVVSFLQGLAALVSFYFFGVSAPALWAFLAFIAALLPVVGPAIIWVPIVLFKYFSGDVSAAVGLAVYSLLVQNLLLDIMLKTKIIGGKGSIPPIIVLLGIIGGIMAFGIVGLLLGPIILVLLIEILKIYLGKNAFSY